MKKIALLMLLISVAPLAAQEQPRPDQGRDPFARYLFPPELIMQRQQEIGLTETQRDQIRDELRKAQGTFTDVQWRVASEAEKMEKLLQAPAIDEARVLAQVDAILALEREIKRTQIMLLVRIRNTLTDAQRGRLMQMRGAD